VKFLLDTNAVIAVLKGHAGILERLQRRRPEDFGLSAIVTHELFSGAFRSQRVSENLARIGGLRLEILSFDPEDARRAGEVRARLASAGTPIGAYDMLIAGQALARGLVLVTRNTGEFQRVDGLRVEDWEA
jgi:tRNA(fMet)-specific endonuclease VapC